MASMWAGRPLGWLYCAAISPAITQPHIFTVQASRGNGSYKEAIFQQAEVAI
jgi:hypothetical protein